MTSAIPFPKEHGVWAMLFTSLAIGFAVAGRITGAGAGVCLSLSMLLMLKAPLREMFRGRRTPRLTAWALLYSFLGGLSILPFLPRVTPELAVLTGAVMGICVPVYLYGLARRREMQARFEIPAMALISLSAAFAYRSAGGEDGGLLLRLWLLCFLFYAASSFRVRSTPRSATRIPGLAYTGVVLILAGGAALTGTLPPLAALAFAPLLEDLWRGLRPRKESFSALGRIELAKTLVFAVLLVAAFRR